MRHGRDNPRGAQQLSSAACYAIDDASLVGAPPRMREGAAPDLRLADAILVDQRGAKTLRGAAAARPGAPARDAAAVGDVIELNDSRARIVGFYDAPPSFQSLPRIYTTWQRVRRFVPNERKMLSFVLVRVAPGHDAATVAAAIGARTGLQALTPDEFTRRTQTFFLLNTGILVTFGAITLVAVLIGFFIAAQTFRNFTRENLRYFGALSAMGADFTQLVGMVAIQAIVASAVGTGLGLGVAAITANATTGSELAGSLTLLQVGITVALMIGVCVVVASLSMRTVRTLEPAAVFRG
jgi:putative ABC transport system permease protein